MSCGWRGRKLPYRDSERAKVNIIRSRTNGRALSDRTPSSSFERNSGLLPNMEKCIEDDANLGGSLDIGSLRSGTKKSSPFNSGIKRHQNCKEFLYRLTDSNVLTAKLSEWLKSLLNKSHGKNLVFERPFDLTELQKLDYALEGVPFQQLVRMPTGASASMAGSVAGDSYLAVEDFLYASVKGLWETFWSSQEPVPLSVGCFNHHHQAEKAMAAGVFCDSTSHPHGRWDCVLELALLRHCIGNLDRGGDLQLSLSLLGEALFFALLILLSRSWGRSKLNSFGNPNCVFVLLVDSQYGGIVKVEGDINKLEFDVNNVYDSCVEWIKKHSRVAISSVDKIWNKFGNVNWTDTGSLQVLLATFHCLVQFAGIPKHSIEEFAAEHSTRLQARRVERQLTDVRDGRDGFSCFQNRASAEIVDAEAEDEAPKAMVGAKKLEHGSVIWLEGSNHRNGYQINTVLQNGEVQCYVASPIDEPSRSLLLYIGSSSSTTEPAWEDMNPWYQVQRQTKILTIMRQKGLSSKFLPQLHASGRIIQPWCGTPVLVTSPAGETVAELLRANKFDFHDVLRCCHDSLSALSSATAAGIRHGDVRPENVIYVNSSSGSRVPYFVLIGWGHAVLKDKDRPIVNLHFSSTRALQEGKLCSASDAESLVYLLYFCCGGTSPDLDSVEGALLWREMTWSRRLIQQKLGDVSALLKAFADYVDSLCGTPYPIDYDLWIRRLRRNIDGKNV